MEAQTPENKIAQAVQGKQVRGARMLGQLPGEAMSALIVFACQLRAAGESLDGISAAMAEKFNVHCNKAVLSRQFRGKWYPEFKKQCGVLDTQIDQHWIARQERRIAAYARLAEKAEAGGDYAGAAKILFLAARERGQVLERHEFSGRLSVESGEVGFGDEAGAVKPFWDKQQPGAAQKVM